MDEKKGENVEGESREEEGWWNFLHGCFEASGTGHEKRENEEEKKKERGIREEKRNPRWPGCAVSLHNDDTPSSLHCLST